MINTEEKCKVRIGIDIDDTITNTTEKMMEYIKKSGIDSDPTED